jgi:hypothetical protein
MQLTKSYKLEPGRERIHRSSKVDDRSQRMARLLTHWKWQMVGGSIGIMEAALPTEEIYLPSTSAKDRHLLKIS